MALDVFSTFDPNNSSLYPLMGPTFWLLLMIPLPLLLMNQSQLPSFALWPPLTSSASALSQTSRTQSKLLSYFPSTLSALFPLLILLNLIGLIPYLLSPTSHLLITASLGLPLWLSLILSSGSFSFFHFLAHLLPESSPHWLSPPLIIVESSSVLVRPATISIRLSANMSAGHIVLALLSAYSASLLLLPSTWVIPLGLFLALYTLFEMAICLIQGYIFFLLLSLYSNDHHIKE